MRAVKLKGTKLFNKDDWGILRNVIKAMNMIVVRAMLLAKLYYLTIVPGPREELDDTYDEDYIPLSEQLGKIHGPRH